MIYKGKDMTLKEFISERHKAYIGLPTWRWEDEGVVYAIQDYHSSMGEFSEEDWNTLHELCLDDVGQMCEEQD